MAIAAIWNVHGQRARNGRGEQRTAAGHKPKRAGGRGEGEGSCGAECAWFYLLRIPVGETGGSGDHSAALRSPLDVPPGSLESGVAWDPIVAIKSAR